MQFMTYFELNEDTPDADRMGATVKIMESGLYPPEGVNIISWMTSPDLWGVVIVEADTMEQVIRAISVWRIASPGFFKMTKTAPAMPVQEILPIIADVSQKLNG